MEHEIKSVYDISNIILKNLSNEQIVKLADKHNIKQFGSEPWNKRFTGGSDDIGGLYAGGAIQLLRKHIL